MNLSRIDAHCHVNFTAFDADRDEVIRRALGDGTGMVVIGTRRDTAETAVATAEAYEGAWAAVGLHPSHLFDAHADTAESPTSGRREVFDPAVYRALVKDSTKVVAIGEFGLDYFRVPEGESLDSVRARQHEVFRAHLDLAWELGLPAMVHIRDGQYAGESATHHDAHADAASIFAEYAAAGKRMQGNIHCFTGTPEAAARYVALGLHISFTGIVAFPPKKGTDPNGDKSAPISLLDVAATVPLDHLLIETDAPYLAPPPHRGARNEPAFVKHVSDAIASKLLVHPSEIDASTLRNTKALFDINW